MPRQFKELIALAKQFKGLYILYAPTIDCVFSASLLLRFFKEYDVDIFLSPFYEVSKPAGEGIIIGVGVTQRSPLSSTRFFSIDDFLEKDVTVLQSTSAHLLKNIKNYWIVPKTIEVLTIAAMLSITRSTLYDENLVEIHKQVLSEALSKDVWEYVQSLRLFGYPRRDVAQALAKTLEPYIVGVSLDDKTSLEIVNRILMAKDKNIVKGVADEIERVVSGYGRMAVPILGNKIVVKNVDEIEDPYEAVYSFSFYMDYKGLESPLYIALEPKLLNYAKSKMYSTLKQFKSFIDNLIKGLAIKRFIVKGVRIGVVDVSTEPTLPPLYTLYRILKGVGLAEDVTVFTNGKEYFMPIQLVEARWPIEKELNVDKNYVVFSNLQNVGDLIK
ncbi:hypothetical protein QPL79_03005 [Ignisphaera sp. 4213-co]|uniref:Phosphoesterase n=1 Tax=Ignisphaera cupida TaxID=3050454 RepID=A0ABD4Z4T6_9CREN|nr:hypothetical protein [Ignisphaera sp. 4213-co]MDK6028331.1 hypothetical protein [Ignisphaera sp. 4213-co]